MGSNNLGFKVCHGLTLSLSCRIWAFEKCSLTSMCFENLIERQLRGTWNQENQINRHFELLLQVK